MVNHSSLIEIVVSSNCSFVCAAKCKLLRTALQKIVTGCGLVALAFVISGILGKFLFKTKENL